jgi:hypothetical protein
MTPDWGMTRLAFCIRQIEIFSNVSFGYYQQMAFGHRVTVLYGKKHLGFFNYPVFELFITEDTFGIFFAVVIPGHLFPPNIL